MVARGICNICNSFFESEEIVRNICDSCYEKEKRHHVMVKEYLIQNRGASIMEIWRDTKVPIHAIKRFIKEERIEYIEEVKI